MLTQATREALEQTLTQISRNAFKRYTHITRLEGVVRCVQCAAEFYNEHDEIDVTLVTHNEGCVIDDLVNRITEEMTW
jgi:predicted DNA-binding ribbon-helix-helix protein